MENLNLQKYLLAVSSAAISILLWFLAIFLINVLLTTLFANRGEYVNWFIRNLLSPIVATVLSLTIVKVKFPKTDATTMTFIFCIFVLLASAIGSVNNYEIYAASGRSEEWRNVFISTIFNCITSIAAAMYFVRK